MDAYIIDTNFFFNLEIRSGLGENPKSIVIKFTELARRLKEAQKAEFFMPPTIREELLTFVSPSEPWVQDFLAAITVKTPHIDTVNFPAHIFYKLIDEIRQRSLRGLQIGEEMVHQGADTVLGKGEMSRIDYQKTIGEVISKLRERHRQATRFNFLDSVADLDLIVLTKELEGFLVSSDEGVVRWGRIFGVKEVTPSDLKRRLEALLG